MITTDFPAMIVHRVYSVFIVAYRATGDLFRALDAAVNYAMSLLTAQAMLLQGWTG